MYCPKIRQLRVKLLFAFFAVIASFTFLSSPVYAAKSVNSVTLNGGSTVTVAPSASIAVQVTSAVSGGGASSWLSTSWNISGANCVDTPDHASAGTYSESFNITAPSTPGTYSVSFIIYADNICTNSPSSTYTMTNAITVSSPTPSPTPTGTPGPTSTPSPISSPGSGYTPPSSPGAASNYAPTIVLFKFPSDHSGSLNLYFSGVVYADEGEIRSLEYMVEGKTGWISANSADGKFDQGSESFSFMTPVLSEGLQNVHIRTKTSLGHTTEITRSTNVVITPPVVKLDKISPNPTDNKSPIISGVATTESGGSLNVEISLDNGGTWVSVGSGGRFVFTPNELDDGNYQVIARATDSGGNTSVSQSQTLVVDTIPPIIGGALMAVGSQILRPDPSGNIVLVANIKTSIAIGMKGGVTVAKIITDDGTFDLHSSGDHLWVGDIVFPTRGARKWTVYAEDGAGNKTQRSFGSFMVEPNGKIMSMDSTPIKGAKVEAYVYDSFSSTWSLWDAAAYRQKNPQIVGDDGKYSFMVPAGKYYLRISADGFYDKESNITQTDKGVSLNSQINLKSRPGLPITLPIIGHVFLGLPSILPAENFDIVRISMPEVKNEFIDKKSPNLVLENENISTVGKKRMISFLSSWSTASLEQAAILSEVARGIGDSQSLQVVALQESPSETKSFMERGGYGFKVLSDELGGSALTFGVTTLPYNVFIDTNGTIRSIVPGIISREEILKRMDNL